MPSNEENRDTVIPGVVTTAYQLLFEALEINTTMETYEEC